jgi:hypothetical protein
MASGAEVGQRDTPLARADRELEINAVAMELLAVKFKPCRDKTIEFARGTALAHLHAQGRFTEKHIMAADRVLRDFEKASGKSGAVTMGWSDKVDKSPAGFSIQEAWSNDAYDRLRLLIDEALTLEERKLFIDTFVHDYFKRWNGERIAEAGWLLQGYTGQDSARTAGITRICALLERIWDYYQGQ